MKLQQLLISNSNEHHIVTKDDDFQSEKADLVLAFGQRTLLEKVNPYNRLKTSFPNGQIIICSSSGQISNQCAIEKEIVATAIDFEKTTIKTCEFDIIKNQNINALGEKIKEELSTTTLSQF